MEPYLYPQMAALEKKHWWFSARRVIINHLFNKLKLMTNAEILEVGCGTGGNLLMLSQYGRVYAVESNDIAKNFAKNRDTDAEVESGSLPDNIPFDGKQFDLIVLFDVLEHVKEDADSLRILFSRLKLNGYLFITVPALPVLWSEHDENYHHHRRYLKIGLRQLVENAGYQVIITSYFNFFLFPMIFATRYLQSFSKKKHNNDFLPPYWLNWLLEKIFASERYFINRRMSLPIGVSLLLLAQKKSL